MFQFLSIFIHIQPYLYEEKYQMIGTDKNSVSIIGTSVHLFQVFKNTISQILFNILVYIFSKLSQFKHAMSKDKTVFSSSLTHIPVKLEQAVSQMLPRSSWVAVE